MTPLPRAAVQRHRLPRSARSWRRRARARNGRTTTSAEEAPGYRQVAVRLNHVTLAVADVESSARFYARLGLAQIVADYPDYARFVAPQGDTTLSLRRADDRPSPELGASIHFEVDDVDHSVEQLKRAGFDFACDPVDQPYLWREAILLDPDGHRIFIYHAGENRLDPPWRIGSEP
jgi:catechol 2,3-dioxygenase-like lactoylglutathione lyase family enzyme